jgi:hypothetical protein
MAHGQSELWHDQHKRRHYYAHGQPDGARSAARHLRTWHRVHKRDERSGYHDQDRDGDHQGAVASSAFGGLPPGQPRQTPAGWPRRTRRETVGAVSGADPRHWLRHEPHPATLLSELGRAPSFARLPGWSTMRATAAPRGPLASPWIDGGSRYRSGWRPCEFERNPAEIYGRCYPGQNPSRAPWRGL